MNYRGRLLLFSSFIIGGFLPLGVIGYYDHLLFLPLYSLTTF